MNKICAFITILVILAILLCSWYHINLIVSLFILGNYITGIGYSIVIFEIICFLFPMLKLHQMM